MIRFAAIFVSMLCCAATAAAAGDPEAGKAKSVTCVACHGVDGNSANPEWPKLAGQHASYIIAQLEAYKSGDRNNALMNGIAMGLDDQDRADLAAYFSSQPIKGGKADPELVAAGERLFRGGNPESGVSACAACHSPNGHGNPGALIPRVAGQHAVYLRQQLQLYASGERRSDMGQMMRNIAALMSNDEMAAVTSYMQGLQ